MIDKTPEAILALAKQCGAIVTPCNNGDATCDFYNRITFDEDDLPAFAAALTAAQPALPVPAYDVEAARLDAERLDWLEITKPHLLHDEFTGLWSISVYKPTYVKYEAFTLRSVTDAAMKGAQS